MLKIFNFSNTYYKVIISIIYIISALYICGMFVTDPRPEFDFSGSGAITFVDIIEGRTYKPFVYRALVPYFIRTTVRLIPATTKHSIQNFLINFYEDNLKYFNELGWTELNYESEYIIEYLLAIFIIFLSLLGFAIFLRKLFSELYETKPVIKDIVPVISLLLLPIFFHRGFRFVYDISGLFFMTLLFYLVYKKKWVWFYPIFIISNFNKETTFLIIISFLFHYKKINKFYLHLFFQLIIFILIRSYIVYIFQDAVSYGSLMFSGLAKLNFLRNIRLSLIAYSYNTIMFYSLVIFLIVYKFSEKPVFLRYNLILFFILLFLYVFFGFFGEIRVFLEVYPILFLLVIHSVLKVISL